jgi:hypothetical protein
MLLGSNDNVYYRRYTWNDDVPYGACYVGPGMSIYLEYSILSVYVCY